MTRGLFDCTGFRKYIVAKERDAFIVAATAEGGDVATFCLTLMFTGARLSECLAITARHIDATDGVIVLQTLKRREKAGRTNVGGS